MPQKKKSKKITIKEYKKNSRWEIFTGLEADKKFCKSLVYNWLYIGDVSTDRIVELINARAELIHKLFTFRNLTNEFDELLYIKNKNLIK